MQITKHADGTVTVDQFDDKIMMTWELLGSLDPAAAVVSSDWEDLAILGVKYEAIYWDASAEVVGFQRVAGQ